MPMTYRHSTTWGRTRPTWRVLLMLSVVAVGACSAREPPRPPEQPCASGAELFPTAGTGLYHMSTTLPEGQAPFAVSLVPTVPVPVRVGAELGFQLSSGTAGYASLYVIDPVYAVQVMAENLPVPAGSLEYPSSQGFTLRAVQPVGFNRAILLVTRQPFSGFSGNDTLDRAGEHGTRRPHVRVAVEPCHRRPAALVMGRERGLHAGRRLKRPRG